MENPAKVAAAQQIKSFRQRLAMTQEELAQQLGLKRQSTISFWESGRQLPERYFCGKLAELARARNDQIALDFFSALMGMEPVAAMAAAVGQQVLPLPAPRLQVVAGRAISKQPKELLKQTAAIPVVRDVAILESDSRLQRLREKDVGDVVMVPAQWCPHRERTVSVTMADDGMLPALPHGSIVGIDAHYPKREQIKSGVMVAAMKGKRLVVRWFRRHDSTEVLAPENEETDAIYITGDKSWRLVGEVLWYLAKPALSS